MARIVRVSRPHRLDGDRAREMLADLAPRLEDLYGIQISVNGAAATISGPGVRGSASVDDETVTVDLTLGLPASLLADQIQAGIRETLDEQFSG